MSHKLSLEYTDILDSNIKWSQNYKQYRNIIDSLRSRARTKISKNMSQTGDAPHAFDTAPGV